MFVRDETQRLVQVMRHGKRIGRRQRVDSRDLRGRALLRQVQSACFVTMACTSCELFSHASVKRRSPSARGMMWRRRVGADEDAPVLTVQRIRAVRQPCRVAGRMVASTRSRVWSHARPRRVLDRDAGSALRGARLAARCAATASHDKEHEPGRRMRCELLRDDGERNESDVFEAMAFRSL